MPPCQSETYDKNVLTFVMAKYDNYNVHIRGKKGQKQREKNTKCDVNPANTHLPNRRESNTVQSS